MGTEDVRRIFAAQEVIRMLSLTRGLWGRISLFQRTNFGGMLKINPVPPISQLGADTNKYITHTCKAPPPTAFDTALLPNGRIYSKVISSYPTHLVRSKLVVCYKESTLSRHRNALGIPIFSGSLSATISLIRTYQIRRKGRSIATLAGRVHREALHARLQGRQLGWG